MAKEKKIAKKDIEKFAKKVIASFTESIIGAMFAKIESDPELRKEYFSLCEVEDKVEELPVKAAKAMKAEKPAKEVKVTKEPAVKKATKVTKKKK